MKKCIFKHKWVYSENQIAKFNDKLITKIYLKRTCAKCEIIQEQNGYFDISCGMENYWINKWKRIK